MIGYIEGRLDYVGEAAILIITDGGVGYEVEVTSRLRQNLPERGGRVRLYTTLLVREDMLRLCGFETVEERASFKVLNTVPKVGPRLALAVLSVFRPAELRQLVATGDVVSLTTVSGIGKRLAEHIVRELSFRMKIEGVSVDGTETNTAASVSRQVLEGLKGLGYAEGECAGVVQEVLRSEPDLDVASALRACLRELGRRK